MSQLKIKDGNEWIGILTGDSEGDVLIKSPSINYATDMSALYQKI